MVKHLEHISKEEDVTLLSDAARLIVEHSDGDLRRAINVLQTASVYNNSRKVDKNTILKVIGEASPKQVQLMLNMALKGNFIEARRMMYNFMGSYGLSGIDIIRQLHREIFKISHLTTKEKAELADIIGEYDFRLVEGANEDIQLSALLAQFSKFGMLKGKSLEK